MTATKQADRAKECRALAAEWRERALDQIGDERRMMLELAGQYDKLAFQLDRMAQVLQREPG